MNICEAILARTDEKPYITRRAWDYITTKPVTASIKILPTNSPDSCTIAPCDLCLYIPRLFEVVECIKNIFLGVIR